MVKVQHGSLRDCQGNNMAYTKNMQHILDELTSYGMDIEYMQQQINGGAGFFINFNKLPADIADSVVDKVRHLLYSWLHLIGVKKYYTVKTKNKSVTVYKKAAKLFPGLAEFGGIEFTPGGFTEADMGTGSMMPDQDAIESAARLEAAMRDDNYFEPEKPATVQDESLPITKHGSVFDHIAETELKAKEDAERARAGSNLQEIDNGKEV